MGGWLHALPLPPPQGHFENWTWNDAVWWHLWQELGCLWVGNLALFCSALCTFSMVIEHNRSALAVIMIVKLWLIKSHVVLVYIYDASALPVLQLLESDRFTILWCWQPRSFNYSQTTPYQCTRRVKTEAESVCTLGGPAAAQHAFTDLHTCSTCSHWRQAPGSHLQPKAKQIRDSHHVHNIFSLLHLV